MLIDRWVQWRHLPNFSVERTSAHFCSWELVPIDFVWKCVPKHCRWFLKAELQTVKLVVHTINMMNLTHHKRCLNFKIIRCFKPNRYMYYSYWCNEVTGVLLLIQSNVPTPFHTNAMTMKVKRNLFANGYMQSSVYLLTTCKAQHIDKCCIIWTQNSYVTAV